MEINNLEKTAKELLSFEGKVKGEVFNTHAEYIKQREGEEGLKKVEEKMAELQVPLEFKKIRSLSWQKEGMSVLMLLVCKKIFGWTDDDIFEMGRFAPKVSFIVRVLARYFVSLDKVFQESPRYWRRHFDFGELEAAELNKDENYMIIRIKRGETHPVVCRFYAGYLKGFAQISIKGSDIGVEETKCTYKGDDYHEYKISWK